MICCCVGTTHYGYFTGGGTGVSGVLTDKLNFSTELTSAATGANLINSRSGHVFASVPDNGGHLYVAGGSSTGSTVTDAIERLTFASDTCAALTSTLTAGKRHNYGLSERSTKGYVLGGSLASNVKTATTEVFTFSSETCSLTSSADLSQARLSGAHGITEGSTKGYICGGYTDAIIPAGNVVATADQITYSSDTTSAQTSANLSAVRWATATASNNGVAGYACGGTSTNVNGAVTTTDKLTYSTDTTAALTTSDFSPPKNVAGGMSDGTTGFFGGGRTAVGAGFTNVSTDTQKLVFATEVMSFSGSAQVSVARDCVAGSDVAL